MRDVLERRFGLRSGGIATLEAIGREYKITRERVRQIEADALKFLKREEHLSELAPLYEAVQTHMHEHGDVMAQHHLLAICASTPHHPDLLLLLGLHKSFQRVPETEHHHYRWTLNKEKSNMLETVLAGVIRDLEKKGAPVSEQELHTIVADNAGNVFGNVPGSQVLQAYLATTKSIGKNPYAEYGLVWWPTVNPAGVKDKAYAALAKAGRPLHFREVAGAINAAGWSKKKAHPQTVHNELIKDSRFVLVGRGLYALTAWGYEPGAVREVLVSVLKNARHPVTKEEAVREVLAKRSVKPQTILLNLQNKSLFKRTDEGSYTLV